MSTLRQGRAAAGWERDHRRSVGRLPGRPPLGRQRRSAGLLRRRFEERSIRVPVSREIREDLHAVQRVVSTGGNVTYSAPRNADGHSDRAAALALCSLAAKSDNGDGCGESCGDGDEDGRYFRGRH